MNGIARRWQAGLAERKGRPVYSLFVFRYFPRRRGEAYLLGQFSQQTGHFADSPACLVLQRSQRTKHKGVIKCPDFGIAYICGLVNIHGYWLG